MFTCLNRFLLLASAASLLAGAGTLPSVFDVTAHGGKGDGDDAP